MEKLVFEKGDRVILRKEWPPLDKDNYYTSREEWAFLAENPSTVESGPHGVEGREHYVILRPDTREGWAMWTSQLIPLTPTLHVVFDPEGER